jgi:hypothetical protein
MEIVYWSFRKLYLTFVMVKIANKIFIHGNTRDKAAIKPV